MTSSTVFVFFYYYIIISRFHVVVRLFRSQETSKFGKNISDTLVFLTYLEVLYDQLQKRRTATWNLFVKLTKKTVVSLIKKFIIETKMKLAWINFDTSYGRIEAVERWFSKKRRGKENCSYFKINR